MAVISSALLQYPHIRHWYSRSITVSRVTVSTELP